MQGVTRIFYYENAISKEERAGVIYMDDSVSP